MIFRNYVNSRKSLFLWEFNHNTCSLFTQQASSCSCEEILDAKNLLLLQQTEQANGTQSYILVTSLILSSHYVLNVCRRFHHLFISWNHCCCLWKHQRMLFGQLHAWRREYTVISNVKNENEILAPTYQTDAVNQVLHQFLWHNLHVWTSKHSHMHGEVHKHTHENTLEPDCDLWTSGWMNS